VTVRDIELFTELTGSSADLISRPGALPFVTSIKGVSPTKSSPARRRAGRTSCPAEVALVVEGCA
jgi:hypothetical protein